MADVKTDKDGKLTVKYLPAGKYTYKETKAPSGYALNPTAYAFEIDEKGVVAGTLIVTDPFANIVIKKVDAKTNKLLAGAQFGLYDSTDKLLTTLTTDNNGLVQFTKLPWGKYSVKELKAPSGYAVNGKLVTVEINETYQNRPNRTLWRTLPPPRPELTASRGGALRCLRSACSAAVDARGICCAKAVGRR